MRARRAFSLLAALALFSPLAALAAPACAPGQHCPMGGLVGDDKPCHAASIQSDNCCLTDAAVEPAAVVPVMTAAALAADDGVAVSCAATGEEPSPTGRVDAQPTPLYRLFRALLI